MITGYVDITCGIKLFILWEGRALRAWAVAGAAKSR